jgi:hypothetical protein
MCYIIFKNSKALYRQEKFGGIVYYKSRLFLLNHFEFNFLNLFKEFKQINQLDAEELRIFEKLLKWEIFLKIDSKEASKIMESNQTSKINSI